MRLLILGFLICGAAVGAGGQCPVQPRQASLDSSGRSLIVRYFNSGTRTVRAVQFTLTKPEAGQNDRSVMATYSAAGTLRPNRDRTAVFENPTERSGLIDEVLTGPVEVSVTRVVFSDLSTWKPPGANQCKISFSQP